MQCISWAACRAWMAPLAMAAVAASGSAHAQTDRWQYEITPYLWAAGLKGDVQLGDLPRTSTDIGFSEIWDNLDFAAMATFEGRKDRWGWLADVFYIKVSAGATSSRTGAGPIGATLTTSSGLKLEQTMLSGAGMHRVADGPTAVDVLGGLRYMKINTEASIEGSLFGQTGFVSRSGSKDWVDPYVGVRIQHALADGWSVMGYLDVGGFGVGSQFTWQTLVGVGYDFSKAISAKFGYRHLDVDYDKDGLLYDMATSGVYLGVGFRF